MDPTQAQKTKPAKTIEKTLSENKSEQIQRTDFEAAISENPEIAALAEKTAKAKIEAQRQSPLETADLKREILESEIKERAEIAKAALETPKIIASLDPNKESVEQIEVWHLLELVSYPLIGKILNAGADLTDLKNFDTLPQVSVNDHKLTNAERSALEKLQAIASYPASPLYQELKAKWPHFCEKANRVYELSLTDKALHWIKENPKKSKLILAAAALGALAYFYYRNDDKDPKSPEKEPSFLNSLGLGSWGEKLAKGGLFALATTVLGSAIGGGNILNWIQENLGNEEKEKLKEVVQQKAIEHGIEWFDKKIQFTQNKEKIEQFCKDHNIAVPEWLSNATLATIAADLGITENNENSWKIFEEEKGFFSLLKAWTDKKDIVPSGALELIFLKEGNEKLVAELLAKYNPQIEQAQTQILKGVEHIPEAQSFVEDAFGRFNIKEHIGDLFKWIKEHPLEGTALASGMFFCRNIIFLAFKKLLGTGLDITKYTLQNPSKATKIGVMGSAALATLYYGRRTFLQDLIKITYEDPKSLEAEAMLKKLDIIFDVDRSKPETLGETQVPAFVKTILENPTKALDLPESYEAYKKGKFAFAIDSAGKIFLLVQGINAPFLLKDLTITAFKSLKHVYSPEYEENRLLATFVVGAECYVLGSMAWGGFKSYQTVLNSVEGKGDKLWRGLLSLTPGTKEWKFVLRSSLVAPFTPVLRKLQGIEIKNTQDALQEIVELLERQSPDFKTIAEKSRTLINHDVFTDFRNNIKKNLTGTDFGYKTAEHLADINEYLRDLNQAARQEDIINVKRHAIKALTGLETTKTGIGTLLHRFQLLTQGKFKEAFATIGALEDLKKLEVEAKLEQQADARATKPIDIKNGGLFKKNDGSFKTIDELKIEADRLRQELNAMDQASAPQNADYRQNPLPSTENNSREKRALQKKLMALEAALDPQKTREALLISSSELDNLNDVQKASKLQSLAADIEAVEKGTQAKFNAEVEKIIQETRTNKLPLTDPKVTEQLTKLDQDLIIPFAQKKQDALKTLLEQYEKLPKEARTPALQAQIRHAIEGVDGTLTTRLVKGAKGRLKLVAIMATLMFATDQLIHRNDPERELDDILSDLGPELGQLLLDVLPVAGTFSNFYSAFSGRELINSKKDVSGAWDRISNVIWGSVGAIGDTITVLGAVPTGGAAIGANAVLRLTKAAKGGSKTAVKLLQMWPKIENIAERMGGFYNLAKRVSKFLNKDTATIVKGLRKIEFAGVVAGSTMLAGGIAHHLYYGFVDEKTELNVPDEIMKAENLPSVSISSRPANDNAATVKTA